MSLFDAFRRKRNESNTENGNSLKPNGTGDEDGPSSHYVFAHVVLRRMALAEPLRMLGALASEESEQFLDAIIADVTTQLGRPTPFDAAAITVHPVRVSGYPCAVLELPVPESITEAHFVGLIMPVDTSKPPPDDLSDIQARYFTLEKGVPIGDETTPQTVLCEWDDEGRHLNYGSGPPPTVGQFIAVLNEQIA